MTERTFLFAGCYTHDSSVGICVFDASDPHGGLAELSQVEGIEHPSFLAAHPNGQVLYAVSETSSTEGGGVVALSIDSADGSLTMIDRVSSQGSAPCYVSVAGDGRYLYVANYVGGSIAVYSLAPDGRFGDLVAVHQHHGSGPTARQEGPHPHCIMPGTNAPANSGHSVYAADLGTDRVIRYAHDGRQHGDQFGPADELVFDPGCGPRHLAFHPEQPVAFVVCELASTIEVLGVEEETGRLTRHGSWSTLPDGFVGSSIGAEVRVHPNGRQVYVSNRGHDSIAVFAFGGPLEPLVPLGHVPSGGVTPRSFAVHPSGRALLVANQDSNSIVRFTIDPATGIPEQCADAYRVSQPVCLTFLEAGR